MKLSPELLTLKDVSKYLRIHPMTAYKWARKRRIPMIKIGGQWRIRFTTLQAWLDKEEDGRKNNG